MIIKKASGELVEVKRELNAPDLVLDAPETEALLQNAVVICLRMLSSMQRVTRSSDYVPDPKDSKMLKELVDVTMTIEGHRQKTAAQDAFAQLSEEELTAKLQLLAAQKLGNKK